MKHIFKIKFGSNDYDIRMINFYLGYAIICIEGTDLKNGFKVDLDNPQVKLIVKEKKK